MLNKNLIKTTTAEALSEASSKLNDTGVTNLKIQIYSDSQAVIKALEKPYNKSKAILECHNNLNKLCLNNQVTLSWVPWHQWYEGNETVDRLEDNGRNQPLADPITIKQPQGEMEKKFEAYIDNTLNQDANTLASVLKHRSLQMNSC